MALAAGLDAGRHLGPLLQVQGDAVHPQGPDAAQETPLASCSALVGEGGEGRAGGEEESAGSRGGGRVDLNKLLLAIRENMAQKQSNFLTLAFFIFFLASFRFFFFFLAR